MRFSISVVVVLVIVVILIVAGIWAVRGDTFSRGSETEYRVRSLKLGFTLSEETDEMEEELLNEMYAEGYELTRIEQYPPAVVPGGGGQQSKDDLTRSYYFRKMVP